MSSIIAQSLYRLNLKDSAAPGAVTKSAGVYAIYHRQSRKFYIGSSSQKVGIRGRMSEHRSDLRRGKHCNRQLQHYFDKHGIESFDLLILEETEREQARQAEQKWFDEFRPWERGFNVLRRSGEYKKRSDATRKAFADRASKPYRLEYKGQIYEGVNLTEFCRSKGLHQGAMTQVLLGNKPQFKGWTLPGAGNEDTEILNERTGETAVIPHLGGNSFARARGLNGPHFNGMLRGKYPSCQGWVLTSKPRPRRRDRSSHSR